MTTARLMTLENMKMNCLREARAYAEKHGYWLTISIKKHSEEFTTNSKMVCFWTSQGTKEHSYAQDSSCIAWLQFFITSAGDHQPDKGCCIDLQSCFSRSDIYKKMLEKNTALNMPSVSLSHFYNILEKYFISISITTIFHYHFFKYTELRCSKWSLC